MEDTLGEQFVIMRKRWLHSLNPCFNGRYSRRCSGYVTISALIRVLILVLMEDTLGEKSRFDIDNNVEVS